MFNPKLTVRIPSPTDLPAILIALDRWSRVHLRLTPRELHEYFAELSGVLVEDQVGLKGILLLERQPAGHGLVVMLTLRDSWSVESFFKIVLHEIQAQFPALLCFSSEHWLYQPLLQHGFVVTDQLVLLERVGISPPWIPTKTIEISEYSESQNNAIRKIEQEVFEQLWQKNGLIFEDGMLDRYIICVAKQTNEEIIGYVWGEIYGTRVHFLRLAVASAHQGQGIGAQLLASGMFAALMAGADRMSVNTLVGNERAIWLYKKFGFEDTKQRLPVLRLNFV